MATDCIDYVAEIEKLKKELDLRNKEIEILKASVSRDNSSAFHFCTNGTNVPNVTYKEENLSKVPPIEPQYRLSKLDIIRYSRQLILPELGVKGQLLLRNTSVLVVGAGGLGCPVIIYLAAAGVGRLGIIDYDEVEINNLHRQVLHSEKNVGISKAASAADAAKEINSSVECIPYHFQLTTRNALTIISKYDIIVDATDNVATRYLVNDTCVLTGRPLVSGSALRFEGQLTIYNYKGGPCYRCLYPVPPPADTVTNCSDGGVLGIVPGIIGCLQALEVIKMIVGVDVCYSRKLLLFDALDNNFRNIKLRSRQANCAICGDFPTITKLVDYEQFCGASATDKCQNIKLIQESERITCKEYKLWLDENVPHLLVDVRQPVELDICRLPNSINIPIESITKLPYLEKLQQEIIKVSNQVPNIPVVVVCHRGNDSQRAVLALRNQLQDYPQVKLKDLIGGLSSWAQIIDNSFPEY